MLANWKANNVDRPRQGETVAASHQIRYSEVPGPYKLTLQCYVKEQSSQRAETLDTRPASGSFVALRLELSCNIPKRWPR